MPFFDVYDAQVPRRIQVDAERVTIGRDAENDILILEPMASRLHCEVRLDPDEGYIVQDLKSRNGTSLNQEPISEPTPLQDGDEIGIGSSALRFWSCRENIAPSAPQLPLIIKE